MKKQKTKEQIEAHEREKAARRKYRSDLTKAKRQAINLCEDKGVRTAELQLQYIKANESAKTNTDLERSEYISQFEAGIREYLGQD